MVLFSSEQLELELVLGSFVLSNRPMLAQFSVSSQEARVLRSKIGVKLPHSSSYKWKMHKKEILSVCLLKAGAEQEKGRCLNEMPFSPHTLRICIVVKLCVPLRAALNIQMTCNRILCCLLLSHSQQQMEQLYSPGKKKYIHIIVWHMVTNDV